MSGDIIIEQDCHNIDVVNWFMGTHPVKACRLRLPHDPHRHRRHLRQPRRHLPVRRPASAFQLQRQPVRHGRGWSDVSETFICEKGTVNISRTGYPHPSRRPQGSAEESPTKYDITEDCVNQFIEGARTGKLENAAFFAAESTLTAVMAREAIYTGKEVTWKQVESA